MRQWEEILWTVLVESCVIDTDAPYVSVFLWNNHWVGDTSQYFDFFDEPGIFEAMKFDCYGFVLSLVKSFERLLYRPCFWIHI
jgi:hypothetical protein